MSRETYVLTAANLAMLKGPPSDVVAPEPAGHIVRASDRGTRTRFEWQASKLRLDAFGRLKNLFKP